MLVKNIGYFDQILFRPARVAPLEKYDGYFDAGITILDFQDILFRSNIISNCTKHYFDATSQ